MESTEYSVMYAEEQSHWWFRGRRMVLLDLARRWGPGPDARPDILDFGCGTGGNTAAYATIGAVVGVELDSGALRFASRVRSARFCQASGTALPLADCSFDLVLASDVLEHIADHETAVREIARVLRPGGRLVFSVPAHPWLWSDHDRALWHQRRYTRKTLQSLVEHAGLRLEWLSYWNAALFPVVAAWRVLGDAGTRRSTPRSDARRTPGLVNRALLGVLTVEAALLKRFCLPFGVSLVGVATRP